MIFKTSYKSGTHLYSSYVKTDSYEEAEELLLKRGLHEFFHDEARRQKPVTAMELFQEHKILKCLHYVTFGSIPLWNGRLYDRNDFLTDTGMIHRLIHQLITQKKSKKYKKKYNNILHIEGVELVARLKQFDEDMKALGY